MRLKSLLFVGLFALVASANAENRHVPDNTTRTEVKTAVKKVKMPGYCEIEIVNCGYETLIASGRVDNNAVVLPFVIGAYSWLWGCERHIIDLYDTWYGYCPGGMRLFITSDYGPVYDRYVYAGTRIRFD